MKVTRHAKQRIHEREGLGKSATERKAQLALERGYRHSDTKGELKKWLDEQWEYKRTANGMRIYGDKLYVFAGLTLVTVLQVPPKFTRNMKAYIRRES